MQVLAPTDPQVQQLVASTHQRFERLVREAEAKAKPLYKRLFGREATIEEIIDQIFADVSREGDAAVVRYAQLFDGATFTPEQLVIGPAAMAQAWATIPSALQQAMRQSIDQVTAYQRQLLPQGFGIELDLPLGVRWTPLARVGAYIPGGDSGCLPLFSTVIMNLVPAKVAGVAQTVIVTPPRRDGSVAPELLAAAHAVGVDEVWTIGGVPAIAALACGTPRLRSVDKIVGPGNIYVTLAKRRAYGRVDIDMLAGPSEILVIADRSMTPAQIAADLLSQAEHDVLSMAVCLALDGCGPAIISELERQVVLLPGARRATAEESLKRFGMVVACDRAEAISLANQIAPEHLELLVADPKPWLAELRNAGAIFVGAWSPEAIGDYMAGPSHTLPTGGTARMWSGIAVDTFLRRTSLINLDRATFERLARSGISMARGEGLEAHARSIESRLTS